MLSAFCTGILNSHRQFFLSYVSPVMWNAGQIAFVVTAGLWGATEVGIAHALAWGVVAGGDRRGRSSRSPRCAASPAGSGVNLDRTPRCATCCTGSGRWWSAAASCSS